MLLSRCLLICLFWFPDLLGAEELAELFSRAYTLQDRGEQVPLDILSGLHNLRHSASARDAGELQHYRKWLNWLSFAPEKLGNSYFRNEPLLAGSSANLVQIVRVGTEISEAGGFLIARHWQHNAEFQTIYSGQPNFIRLSVKRNGVDFGITSVVRRGVNGGLDSDLRLPFFPIVQGRLLPGDMVTIEYRNLALPELASQVFTLPVYFRTNASSGFYQVPQNYLQIHAGPVATAEILVPSRINPGESFVTKILLKDQYGNPSEGRAPSFDVLVDGSLHSRLDADVTNHHEITSIRFESRGDHSITVRSSGGGISGKSNPFVVQYGDYKVFWGDPNSHISLGEGSLSAAEVASRRDLDFSITTVHNRYLTPTLWQSLPSPKAWLWGNQLKYGGQHLAITEAPPVDASSQTELMRLLRSDRFTTIALAEIPADDRFLNNRVTRLVEILSGESRFEWFANRLLSRGYRVGFTASNHSHLSPVGYPKNKPLTAVIVSGNTDWLAALSKGRSFVTTGARIMLEVRVNGGLPGTRTAFSSLRRIKGYVKGTGPIHKIELVKNGTVIDHRDIALDANSKSLKISLYSDSAPLGGQRDLPRNGREWIGFLRTVNARLITASAPGFQNPARQALAINPVEENRVDFITWTRGSTSSFMVDFETDNEDAVLELNFRNGHEDTDVSPLNRPSAEIPGYSQIISIFELKGGPVVRRQRILGYEDRITLELVNKDAPANVEFDFVDQSESHQGDYYYVRVLQLDDHMAWSSPVFVGGFDQP